MSTSTADSQCIAILGCGFMGTAMLQGWLNNKASKTTFTAYTRTSASIERLRRDLETYPGHDRVQFFSGQDVVKSAEKAGIVLLGFEPGSLSSVCKTPGLAQVLKDKIVINMLAGVSAQQVASELAGAGASVSNLEAIRVVKIIPTIGARIGESVTLLATDPASPSEPEHVRLVTDLLGQFGSITRVPENLMDEATAIGAAINALAMVAVDAATDASVADGVPRSVAADIVASSLKGAASLLTTGGMSPEQMKAAMSTPAGITLNSVVHLDTNTRAGISGVVRHAIKYTRNMAS